MRALRIVAAALLRPRRFARTALRAGLSDPADHHRGAVRAGGCDGHLGAHRRTATGAAARQAGGRGEPARRRHGDRIELRRQGRARRLHAAAWRPRRRWRSTSRCTRSCRTIRRPTSSRLRMVAQSPFVLIVNPSLPVNSVQELIELRQGQSRQADLSAPAAPARRIISIAELFTSMTGIKMTHVPYKGSVPALNDVVAGHIQLMFCDVPPSAGDDPGRQGARARRLDRRRASRRCPTFRRSTRPACRATRRSAWHMVVAPAKTPRADRRQAAQRAQGRARAAGGQGADRQARPAADGDAVGCRDAGFVKSEIARWGKVVEAGRDQGHAVASRGPLQHETLRRTSDSASVPELSASRHRTAAPARIMSATAPAARCR